MRRSMADEWAAVELEFGGEETQLALVAKVCGTFPDSFTDRAILGATATCVVLARTYATAHAYGTKAIGMNLVAGYQAVASLLEKVNSESRLTKSVTSAFPSAATFEAWLILRTRHPFPAVNAIFDQWMKFDPLCPRRKYLRTCWTFCKALEDVRNLCDEDTNAPALAAVIHCLSLANPDHVFEMPSMYATTMGNRSGTSIRPLRIACEKVVKRVEVVGRVMEASGRSVRVLPIGKQSVRKDAPRFANVNIAFATITASRGQTIAADLEPHVGHEVPFCVRFITGSRVVRAVFHGGVCFTCGQHFARRACGVESRFSWFETEQCRAIR